MPVANSPRRLSPASTSAPASTFFHIRLPFNIDGIDYDANLYFRSGQLSLDSFPDTVDATSALGLVIFKRPFGDSGVPPFDA